MNNWLRYASDCNQKKSIIKNKNKNQIDVSECIIRGRNGLGASEVRKTIFKKKNCPHGICKKY